MASIKVFPAFERQLKRLAKKYPSLRQEYRELYTSLENEPIQGIFLGKNCYKIRLAIASKGRGKSGGGRVITCVQVVDDVVYLLAIFDKADQEDLADGELDEILKALGLEQQP